MINDNTILSSFNDRPTLLEWLKKVEDALKSDTATGVSVENPSVNAYVFKITFADGTTIASDTIRFPDSVKGVSISNNHLIVTMQSGLTDDLGVINPYANAIVLNSEANTTEIVNNAVLDGNLQVNGNVLFGSSIISIQGTTKQNGILGTNAEGKIAFKEISGGSGDNFLYIGTMNLKSNSASSITNEIEITQEVENKITNGEINIISGYYSDENRTPKTFTSILQRIDNYGSTKVAFFEGLSITNHKLNYHNLSVSSGSNKITDSISIYNLNA